MYIIPVDINGIKKNSVFSCTTLNKKLHVFASIREVNFFVLTPRVTNILLKLKYVMENIGWDWELALTSSSKLSFFLFPSSLHNRSFHEETWISILYFASWWKTDGFSYHRYSKRQPWREDTLELSVLELKHFLLCTRLRSAPNIREITDIWSGLDLWKQRKWTKTSTEGLIRAVGDGLSQTQNLKTH